MIIKMKYQGISEYVCGGIVYYHLLPFLFALPPSFTLFPPLYPSFSPPKHARPPFLSIIVYLNKMMYLMITRQNSQDYSKFTL